MKSSLASLYRQQQFVARLLRMMATGSNDAKCITEEQVAGLSYRQGIRLLMKLDVDTSEMRTLADIQRFLRLRFLQDHRKARIGFKSIVQPLEEDKSQREKLMGLCEDVDATLNCDRNQEMYEILQHIDDDLGGAKWAEQLGGLQERLQKQHTPILVAGETGCGKSSLINLLLGERLLPEADHPCTAVICTVRHGEERQVRLKKRSSSPSRKFEEKVLQLAKPGDKETDENAKVWEEFIKNRDELDDGNQSSKRAHFSSPLPMIGNDEVYFVDSPGIREGRVLDEVMQKYLPKCAAAIVVFMSDNCGGFNESVERFLRLLRQQFDRFNVAQLSGEGSSARKSPNTPSANSVVFVFNRWDKVEDHETPARTRQLRRTCLERLSRLWGGEVSEGHNVFFMSVSKIFSMTEQRARAPEEFQQFQTALATLVPRCLKARLETSATWIERLLRNVLDITRSKINFARRDDQEKHQEEQKLRTLIDQMSTNYDQGLRNLENDINMKKTRLRQELLCHLRSDKALARMKDFRNDADHYGSLHEDLNEITELPDGDDFETVGCELQIFFLKRINREIRFWNECDAVEVVKSEDGVVRRVNHQLTRFGRFQNRVVAECRSTFYELEKEAQLLNELLSSDPSAGFGLDSRDPLGGHGKSEFLSNLEKVFFGMTAVIWVPLVLVGGAISFPVIAGFVVHDKRGQKQKLKNYKENKELLAGRWLANYVKVSFKEELLDNLIHDMVLDKIAQVQYSVQKFIPLARSKFLARLENLRKEKRDLTVVRRVFSPILGKVESVLQNFYGFHAQYLKEFAFSREDFRNLRDNPISMGAFGDIYAAQCLRLNRRVAVKIIKTPVNKGSALDIYTEEMAWWRLCSTKNRNILNLYGLALLEDLRVGFVMDLCDGTLQDLLKSNPMLVPHRQKNLIARMASFRLTLSLVQQVTEGLHCVHDANYIHRDLKLENVLYVRKDQDYVLKLCDFGLSKGKTEVTTTTAGTTLYMSPEVLQQHGCSKASDIYALGIIFWEMYYGSQAFLSLSQECGSIFELSDAIRNGKAKLDFPEKDDYPPTEFRLLIEKCASYEWRDRPEIIDVKSQLLAMESDLSNKRFFRK